MTAETCRLTQPRRDLKLILPDLKPLLRNFDLRNSIVAQLDVLWILISRIEQFLEAMLEVRQELLQIDTHAAITIRFEFFSSRVVQLAGPAEVLVSEMKQGHGRLDQHGVCRCW